jgi:hypothetical protein
MDKMAAPKPQAFACRPGAWEEHPFRNTQPFSFTKEKTMTKARAKLLTTLTLAALSLGFTGTVAAEESRATGSGPNPYSDCGIGAALFSETAWAAVTSNVIWDLGITAITSATASPQTCSGKKVKTAQLIGTSYEALAQETAAGSGRHLATLMTIQECPQARQQAAIDEMRGQLAKVVADGAYTSQSRQQKATDMYFISEQASAHNCQI